MRILAVAFVLFTSQAFAGETIRICLESGVKEVTISAHELFASEDLEGAASDSVSSPAVVRTENGKILVNGRERAEKLVRFRTETPNGILTINGMKLHGDVVVGNQNNALVAMNVIPIEEYLIGVLGSEMSAAFPLEALKAQAVASRTFALQKKLLAPELQCHVESSVLSQVYKGLEVDDPKIREAVSKTHGQVLTFMLQPIEAYFHSSCGGKTETGFESLGRDLPYLKSVTCPCGVLHAFEWSTRLTNVEIQKLSKNTGAALSISEKTASGRAKKVRAGKALFDARSFREQVGFTRVKSLDFTLGKEKTGVFIRGRGFGHASGMCQWGAKLLAEGGQKYEAILKRYYPGTELQKLYE